MDEWTFRHYTSVGLCNSTEAKGEKTREPNCLTSYVVDRTSQFTEAALAFAHALEQKLCNTPEVESRHLGCRWQFYDQRVRNRTEKCHLHPYLAHVVLVRVVRDVVVGGVLWTRAGRCGGSHSGRLSVPQVWKIW